MELKLTFKGLRIDHEEEEKRKRAEQAKERRKKSEETIEEAFARISKMELSEKERELFELAREGYFSGQIARLSDGQLTKGEVLSMGQIMKKRQEEKIRSQRIREVIENKPSNFHILTHDDQLPGFLDRLREEVRLQMTEWKDRFQVLGVESMTAGDFEGTGVDSYVDLSIGFGIWLPILGEGYYLPYGHVDLRAELNIPDDYAYKEGDPQLTRSKVIETISPYLSNPRHGKTFHMGSTRYDLHIARNDGYIIRGLRWDTRDAMYIMTEHLPSYGLKPLIQRYGKYIDQFFAEKYGKSLGLGEKEIYTFEDLFGEGSPAPYSTEIVGTYGIFDVLYGWALFEWQFETMAKTNRLLDCYARIDSRLPEVDVYMARWGFEIDLDGMKRLEEDFTAKLERAKKDLFTAYNIDDEFLRKMSHTINGDKIAKWQKKQEEKRRKLTEQIAKNRAIIEECEKAGKTHLKKYQNAIDAIARYEKELAETSTDEKKCPDYIHEFELTNNRHIAFLIYDHLKIEDKTPRVKKGKSRSVSADILEMYFEDEESLKPLATIAEYEKLLNTYVRKIPEAMEVDGRFHCEWKSTGTSTGRYSSSGYNGRPNDLLADLLD